MPIRCNYCDGVHTYPKEVKACWSNTQQRDATQTTSPELPEHDEVSSHQPKSRDTPEIGHIKGMRLQRGPAELGRNIMIRLGDPVPEAWSNAPRLRLDFSDQTLKDLRSARLAAKSMILELPDGLSDYSAETDLRSPYQVGVDHRFLHDEIWQLAALNTIDLREPSNPRWVLAEMVLELGARASDNNRADVVLPDGTPAWIDGGLLVHREPINGTGFLNHINIEHGSLRVLGTNSTTAELAEDQLSAVTTRTGTARIIAPAGSGKTRVLTERAKHLVEHWNIPATAVSLVAFNKRAQIEMSRRTASIKGLEVKTLNAIALAIVNGAPPYAPQPHVWRTISEREVRRILGKFVSTKQRLNTDPLAPWIDALSKVRLGLSDPASVEENSDGDLEGLETVYQNYCAELENARVLDFDGQIDKAIRVLLGDASARRAAQLANRLLLVDEFQDLTPAHLVLIRLISAPGNYVFGVGDDDQTIYGHTGADPGWLIDFPNWFYGAEEHALQVNYRCPAQVVEQADRLLRHNTRRVAKEIRPTKGSSNRPTRTEVVSGPLSKTLEVVIAHLDSGEQPQDIAVLTRVNSLLAPIQIGLSEREISVNSTVGQEFLSRPAIRATLAWLRLAINDRMRPEDLHEALRRPSRGLSPNVLTWTTEQTDIDGLLRLSKRLNNEKESERVRGFAQDLQVLRQLAQTGASTRRLVSTLINEIGLAGAVSTLDGTRVGTNRASQSDDLTALDQLAALHPEASTFESWLSNALGHQADEAGVTLSTVHRVKGQEWPHVIVHQADSDQFPHKLAENIEEERRLFHVAITRCSQSLTLVTKDPSPFINELTTEPSSKSVAMDPIPRRPTPKRGHQVSKSLKLEEHSLITKGTVMAGLGLVLEDQGQKWTIIEIDEDSVLTEYGDLTRRFKFGSKVQTQGKQRGTLVIRDPHVSDISIAIFDHLRVFREERRAGKPAYTVFTDVTLALIAEARPGNYKELAKIKGIGPTKLENYGDEILVIVEEEENREL